ncbi:hypothetical protein [Burkholderia singularis]|uniref:hypothetical protein n=1 Tax=Burkholderia singularis TaxID=1503053 RepID=UPI001FE015CB|nr:hypothetical protein [Burkholderia singularis]
MKLVGYGLLLFTFTSSTFAGEHYVEIWNPPEARAGVTHHEPAAPAAPAAQKPAVKRKRAAPHVVDAHIRRPSVPTVARIAPKPRGLDGASPRATPAPSSPEIPRLFTPDGNVLRVGARGYRAGVVR